MGNCDPIASWSEVQETTWTWGWRLKWGGGRSVGLSPMGSGAISRSIVSELI